MSREKSRLISALLSDRWLIGLDFATLISLVVFLFVDYPNNSVTRKLLGHASSSNTPSTSTLKEHTSSPESGHELTGISRRHLVDFSLVLAFLLLIVPPVVTAALAYRIWRAGFEHLMAQTGATAQDLDKARPTIKKLRFALLGL